MGVSSLLPSPNPLIHHLLSFDLANFLFCELVDLDVCPILIHPQRLSSPLCNILQRVAIRRYWMPVIVFANQNTFILHFTIPTSVHLSLQAPRRARVQENFRPTSSACLRVSTP